jgi:cleavage and polyadenylation specificity factor subunit 1
MSHRSSYSSLHCARTDGTDCRLPYAPSHIFPLASLITASASYAGGAARSSTLNNNPAVAGAPPVRNIIDMVFLPGFNEPTLALLYAPELTWAGRLENVSSNCLVSLITLATGSAKPGSSATAGTTAVVIATSPSLPHSCLAVHPCPPDLGGTLVITANGILHLEQGGKVIGTPSNTWFGKEWFGIGGRGSNPESTVREGLEGARIVFLANDKALVYCKTGTILQLTMQTSGRSVSSMKLEKVATGVSASCVERIRGSVGRFGEQGYVFVGSEVGESALMSWKVGKVSTGTAAVDDMEVDDFDDEGMSSSLSLPRS